MGFRSLQHTRVRRSTSRGLARPLRSALRVWLPSRRFAPSEPLPVLFHTGGAPGIRPFGAFSSRKVPAAFPRWMNPHTVSPVGIPARRSGWAGPTSRGFRAFTLPGVPGSPAGVNSPTAGCSLGLFPSRVFRRPAWPGPSPVLLPRASAITSLATSNRRRLGVSIGTPPGPAHTVRQAGQNGQDNPHRVLAPARSRPFERAWVRAILFTSCRAVRCRRQADTPETQRPSLY